MKLIKLIRGAYGYRAPGSMVTELITRNSPPFEVENAEAKRLVALGVAEYAQSGVATAPQEPTDQPEGGNPPDGDKAGETPPEGNPANKDYGLFMTAAELRSYMDERSIAYDEKDTKAKLIEAIDAHYEEGVNDGEAPPTLTVQDATQ